MTTSTLPRTPVFPVQDQPSPIWLVEEIFDTVVNYEEAYDQSVYRAPNEASACGTAMCIAGWTPIVLGWSYAVPSDKMGDGRRKTSGDSVRIPSERKAELPPDLQREIIHSGRYLAVDVDTFAMHALGMMDESTGHISADLFSGSNSLEYIRRLIDQCRVEQELPKRDFATEPIPLLGMEPGDGAKPGARDRRQVQKARVRLFNMRARDGIIDLIGAAHFTRGYRAEKAAYEAKWGVGVTQNWSSARSSF